MQRRGRRAAGQHPTVRLDLGIMIALVSLGIGGILGVIAVLDAGSDIAAVGKGFGVAVIVFQAGATIAAALACLARGRLELLALGGLVASCLAIDLAVLEIWLSIDSEAYGKLVGVAYVWTVFALLVLGLALAAQPRDQLARGFHLAAIGASLLGGVIATVLIVSAGDDEVVPTTTGIPYGAFGNEDLLRPLGAVLVVLATLWFAALAASRVPKDEPPSHVEADV
jgi:hypothetical protein